METKAVTAYTTYYDAVMESGFGERAIWPRTEEKPVDVFSRYTATFEPYRNVVMHHRPAGQPLGTLIQDLRQQAHQAALSGRSDRAKSLASRADEIERDGERIRAATQRWETSRAALSPEVRRKLARHEACTTLPALVEPRVVAHAISPQDFQDPYPPGSRYPGLGQTGCRDLSGSRR